MKHLPLAVAALFLVAQATSAQDARWVADSRGPPGAAELHAALRLQPEQEPAWRALQAATTPDPARMAQARGAMAQLASMTTPERLDFTQARMRGDAADFAVRAAAIRSFYAQLSPAQQPVFDRLTGPPPPR